MKINMFNYFGQECKDRITGFTGIAVSITFDLYGCTQILLNPGINQKDGNLGIQSWFDFHRLVIVNATPAMERPNLQTSLVPIFKDEITVDPSKEKTIQPGPSIKPPLSTS
jgi:hypothetical protein